MLTNAEAAAFINVKPGTLDSWRYMQREGQPPYHKLGRLIRYRLGELESWLESNRVES
ncbi:helix-turn-helix domain-containing protein [Schlesneria sp. DSM 10557]|uniref:helix-turn-helix domain-containing protein n=1 Tax=Schlesneria sp. DSM 10557 TaxID=3044399 RepID=UPI00359FCE67